MDKKIVLLIGLCLAAIVLSNVLGAYVLPLFPMKPEVADAAQYWRWSLNKIIFPLAIYGLPLISLLPLILDLLRRYPLSRLGRARFILLHFSVCFVFSLFQILIHMRFEPDHGHYYGDVFYRLFWGVFDYFGSNFIFYGCVVAAGLAVVYFRELRRKEIDEARLAESLANARLSSLKMKLQPHFIFNALQSVNVLMLDKRIEPASEMISRLGRLLRHSIDMDESQMVTVEEEMETVQNYLAIEEIRFKDRLRLEKNIDPKVHKAVIPGLILQPLIENAIKHGIAKKIGESRIWIDIRREKNNLIIAVKNQGQELPAGWTLDENSGFGLRVTQKRLELIYGKNFSVTVKNTGKGEVSSEIAVPYSEEILSLKKEGAE